MAKQTINIGTTANDGTGDPLRTAFDKVNDNFDELYATSAFSGSYTDLTNKPTSITSFGITDSTAGYVLTTDGSAGFTFQTKFPSRSTATKTTASLANDAQGAIDITGFKSYSLMSIETDRAAWVRLYTTTAARTADTSRTQGVDPDPNAGVIAEVITSGASTVAFTPAVLGFNNESTPTTVIPALVKNLSGSTSTVQVTLKLLQLED